MPNFSSLACLEGPEKFLWWVVGGWGLQSHFHVKPNCCVEVRVRVRVGVLKINNNSYLVFQMIEFSC